MMQSVGSSERRGSDVGQEDESRKIAARINPRREAAWTAAAKADRVRAAVRADASPAAAVQAACWPATWEWAAAAAANRAGASPRRSRQAAPPAVDAAARRAAANRRRSRRR